MGPGDVRLRSVMRAEEGRARELESHMRWAADKAAVVEQISRGAHAATRPSEVKLAAEDWKALAAASGGPGALLDAMDGLLASALRKAFEPKGVAELNIG